MVRIVLTFICDFSSASELELDKTDAKRQEAVLRFPVLVFRFVGAAVISHQYDYNLFVILFIHNLTLFNRHIQARLLRFCNLYLHHTEVCLNLQHDGTVRFCDHP